MPTRNRRQATSSASPERWMPVTASSSVTTAMALPITAMDWFLAELQNKDLVRKSTNGGTTNDKMTFNQAYSGLVMEVGNNTSQAKTLLKANESKLIQSTGIFESVSGVNLEEEAANLIRFQQSYAASAQIVSTAKTIFDTLLSSVR